MHINKIEEPTLYLLKNNTKGVSFLAMCRLLRTFFSFLLLIVVVSISGCVATQEDVGGLYARQNKLEARLDRISKEIKVLKKQKFGVSPAPTQIGDQIFQLETKLYDLEQKIGMLDRKLATLETYIQDIKKEHKSLLTRRPVPTAPSTVVSTLQVPDVTKPQLDKFDIAYRELSEGKYKSSRKHFREFIKENPNSTKIADALFWIADSYYREGEYEDAILAYQKLIDSYPHDPRVPLAYLKQGLSLLNMNKKEEAKLFFESLIEKFPDSEEAQEAKRRLRELEL